MIRWLTRSDLRFRWLVWHSALGLVSIFTPFLLVPWFYFVLFLAMPTILQGSFQQRQANLAALATYLVSFELLARMARTSPIIPYELSKYLMFVLLVLGILQGGARGRLGWWMLLFLIPSLFVDVSGQVDNYQLFVFNLMGPVNTALAVVFFSKCRIGQVQFEGLLFLLLCPLVSVLSFAYFKTPDYDEIVFNLRANFSATGGFGSNQVSTVLGLGMFLVFAFWINRWPLTGHRLADVALLFGFGFQGLLTFSRGGIIGGLLAVLVVLFVLWRTSPWQRRRFRLPVVGRYLIPAVLLSAGAFIGVNRITGGMLGLRYQGETAGTAGGYREKSLSVVTSNRSEIFIGDLALWAQNPLFGGGVGASRFIRERVNGVIAHVELSRLLAEHGLLGLLYFILLVVVPWSTIRRVRAPMLRGIQLALFFLALYTTFHAAMRTYVTPLLTGISMMAVVAAKPKEKPHSSSGTPPT